MADDIVVVMTYPYSRAMRHSRCAQDYPVIGYVDEITERLDWNPGALGALRGCI